MKQVRSSIPNFLAINIRFLRKRHCLSQGVFAERIGLNRGNIASYENGTCEPNIGSLKNLSHFFNVSIGDLTGIDLSCPVAHATAVNKFSNKQICESELIQKHLNSAEKTEQLLESLYLTFHMTAENMEDLPKDIQFLILNFDQMYKRSKKLVNNHKELLGYLQSRIC